MGADEFDTSEDHSIIHHAPIENVVSLDLENTSIYEEANENIQRFLIATRLLVSPSSSSSLASSSAQSLSLGECSGSCKLLLDQYMVTWSITLDGVWC